MVVKRIRRIAFLTAAGYGVYVALFRPWHLRWGATNEEAERPLPGDDLVARPQLKTTRAVNICAPSSEVWPWIVQMGQGRGGFYSYDWLENLLGLNIHNADSIVPELQHLEVGDAISLAPNNAMPLGVEVIEPPHTLVLRTGDPRKGGPAQPGDYLRGEIAGTWAFILEDAGESATRLIIRWRADWRPNLASWAANRFVLEPAQFVMERRMLLGIKERAERRAGVVPARPPEPPPASPPAARHARRRS